MSIHAFLKSRTRNFKKEETGKTMLYTTIFYSKVSKDIPVMLYTSYAIKFYLFKRKATLHAANVFKIYTYFCYEASKKKIIALCMPYQIIFKQLISLFLPLDSLMDKSLN